jgi:hypothetical protein
MRLFLCNEISNFVTQSHNMTTKELVEQIQLKRSFLCVGLDSDLSKIPSHLLEFEDPIFEFNKSMIANLSKDVLIGFDPSYLSKSGKKTHGVGYFWSGVAGKAKWLSLIHI